MRVSGFRFRVEAEITTPDVRAFALFALWIRGLIFMVSSLNQGTFSGYPK